MLMGKVQIQASIVVSGGTTNGAQIGDGIVNLVRRIRVLANKAAPNQNGSSRYVDGALVNCSSQALCRFATIERQGKYVAELSGNNLGNGAAGTYNIFLSIPIYFGDSVNLNNVQTALNLNPVDSTGRPVYSAVQVQIEWAAALGELFAGNDRNMAISGFVRWDDQRLDLSIDPTPLKQEDHYVLIQAAYEEFVDQAMPNDGAFESWLVLAQQGANNTLSDAIVNRLKMQGPGSINFKRNWQAIRQEMIDSGFYDPSTTMTGQLFLDFTCGSLRNSNAAAGLQHQFSVNNPSGAGLDQLRIYTRRVFGFAA
jgi:hypothetical protein